MNDYEYIMQTIYSSSLVKTLAKSLQKAKQSIPKHLHTELFLGGSTLAKLIWNHKTNNPEMYAISDIDLIYFDIEHTTYHDEDIIITNMQRHLPDEIKSICDIKNQARVHIWHQEHFDTPIEPYRNINDVLNRATATIQMIAISLERQYVMYGENPQLIANDITSMNVHPNKNANLPQSYEIKTNKWKSAYAQLKIN